MRVLLISWNAIVHRNLYFFKNSNEGWRHSTHFIKQSKNSQQFYKHMLSKMCFPQSVVLLFCHEKEVQKLYW